MMQNFSEEDWRFEFLFPSKCIVLILYNFKCRFDRGPVKPDDTDGKNSIFVSKLGPSIVTDSDLIALFHRIGPIASAALQKASNGRSKGWG